MNENMNSMDVIREEQFLKEHVGKRNPFRVPEGYFDELPSQVLNRVRRQQRRLVIRRFAVAAVLTGCVATVGMLLLHTGSSSSTVAENDTYMEEVLDYTLTTNLDIDSFLTEAE